MAVNFEIGQGYSIPKDAQVKVKEYTNDVKTVTYVSNKSNNLRRYKRINNKEYIDKKTGEILQYNVQEVKTEKSLKRTLNGPLADLLINNFTGGNNQIFVTLTFEWDMNDFNKLKWYFDRFWSRLCYKYKSCNLACIYVKEKIKQLYAKTEEENIWAVRKNLYCAISKFTGFKGQESVVSMQLNNQISDCTIHISIRNLLMSLEKDDDNKIFLSQIKSQDSDKAYSFILEGKSSGYMGEFPLSWIQKITYRKKTVYLKGVDYATNS